MTSVQDARKMRQREEMQYMLKVSFMLYFLSSLRCLTIGRRQRVEIVLLINSSSSKTAKKAMNMSAKAPENP